MGIFRWIFGNREKGARDPASTSRYHRNDNSLQPNDDHLYSDNQDVTSGLEFRATLQIRTPLSVLEHHGETFRGPPSKAPVYCSEADGGWDLKLKSWAELARNESVKRRLEAIGEPEHECASDVGLVKPSEYLPFLKDFRRIVENPSAVSSLLNELDSLARSNPTYQHFWQKLNETYRDFPKSFFYTKFTEAPGIGAKAAKAIFESGIHSVAELCAASEADLIDIPGIGKKTLERLRAHFCRDPK